MNNKKIIWLVIIALVIFVIGAGIVVMRSMSTVTPLETPVTIPESSPNASVTAEEAELQNLNLTLPESDFTDLQEDANSL